LGTSLRASYPQVIEVRRDDAVNHADGTRSDGETGSRKKRVDEIRLEAWGSGALR